MDKNYIILSSKLMLRKRTSNVSSWQNSHRFPLFVAFLLTITGILLATVDIRMISCLLEKFAEIDQMLAEHRQSFFELEHQIGYVIIKQMNAKLESGKSKIENGIIQNSKKQ